MPSGAYFQKFGFWNWDCDSISSHGLPFSRRQTFWYRVALINVASSIKFYTHFHLDWAISSEFISDFNLPIHLFLDIYIIIIQYSCRWRLNGLLKCNSLFVYRHRLQHANRKHTWNCHYMCMFTVSGEYTAMHSIRYYYFMELHTLRQVHLFTLPMHNELAIDVRVGHAQWSTVIHFSEIISVMVCSYRENMDQNVSKRYLVQDAKRRTRHTHTHTSNDSNMFQL